MHASVQPHMLSLGSEVITVSVSTAKVTLRRRQKSKRSVISEIIWEGFNLVEPEGLKQRKYLHLPLGLNKKVPLLKQLPVAPL